MLGVLKDGLEDREISPLNRIGHKFFNKDHGVTWIFFVLCR